MPEKITVHSATVRGGMVDKVEPFYLDQQQTVLLQNSDPTQPFSRKRRGGVADQGGANAFPQGLWRAQDTTLNQQALFAAYGGKVYIVPGAGVVAQRASGVSLTSHSLHMAIEGYWENRRSQYVCMAQTHDTALSLATHLFVITDDNQYSQTASMAPTCAAWFQYRLWCANNLYAENRETVWFSELNDGLSYSLSNSLQIEPGIGGDIMALVPLREDVPKLLVLKREALAVLEPRWGSEGYIPQAGDALDTTNSRVRILSQNVGCVATRSVQYVPGSQAGDIIFLGRDGFRSIQRDATDVVAGASPPLSDNIHDTIRRINYSYVHKAVSCVHENFYHCAVPLDGAEENNYILTLDLETGSWYLNTWSTKDLVVAQRGLERNWMWSQYSELSTDCSVTGAFEGYHVFQCDTGVLDPSGAPIQFQEDTRAFLLTGDIQQKCVWDSFRISVKNAASATAAFTMLYNVDQEGWVTAASMTTIGQATPIILGEDPLPWASREATITTQKFALNDAPPGYSIQIRYLNADLSIPTVVDVAVKGEPIEDEYDNAIT